MAFTNDEVFDQGLDWAITNGTRLDILSSDPGGTYSNVTANTLGNRTITMGATENGAVDGRRTRSPAITDGSVTSTGTATHWAIHNNTDTVVASGPLSSSQAVTSGNTFTLDQVSVGIRDATSV
jgi:hypothetical protein